MKKAPEARILRPKREEGSRFSEQFRKMRGHVLRVLIGVLTFGVVFAVLYFTAIPEQLEMTVGEIADSTVYAPRDVVDTVTTEALRDDAYAEAMTHKQYSQNQVLTEETESGLEEAFAAISKAREMAAEEYASAPQTGPETEAETPEETTDESDAADGEEGSEEETAEVTQPVQEGPSVPEYTAEFITRAIEISGGYLTESELTALLNMSQENYETLTVQLTEQIMLEMNNGVTEENLATRRTAVSQRLSDTFTAAEKLAADAIIAKYLCANQFYDEASTVLLAETAAAEVEDVVIRKGQRITSQGEPVTEVQLQLLTELGLIDNEDNHFRILFGLIIVLLMIFGTTALYLAIFDREYLFSTDKLLMLCLSCLFTVGICVLTQKISVYLAPAMLMALWMANLTNRRMAAFLNVMMALLAGIMATDVASAISSSSILIVMGNILGGTAAIMMLGYGSTRITVLGAGLVGGLAFATSLAGVEMLTNMAWKSILTSALLGLGNGVVAGVICLGTLALWENVFHLVTPMKLLELSNPNQPLLKKLLLEAPGTYHHSIIVGNLAESAAEAVGANPMLARTGAFYHDIGKIRRPYFFKENQVGSENPHDSITPALSCKIITSHVSDGLEMAKKHHLPPTIQDMIEQSHGNTIVRYFYWKASQEAEDLSEIREEDFRYPGKRPSSKEAAILMMADSVEAAARTLTKPGAEELEELVRKIVKGKMDDGQMDECDLTMGDFEKVIHVFVNVLSAVYHERIVYPEDIKKKKEERA